MVYCGVASPYLSSSHLEEGDDSSEGGRNCNEHGSYTRRGKYVDKFGIGIDAIGKPNDVVARYG
jgi:hypothetical protein